MAGLLFAVASAMCAAFSFVGATSMKMDFLPIANVRTDALLYDPYVSCCSFFRSPAWRPSSRLLHTPCADATRNSGFLKVGECLSDHVHTFYGSIDPSAETLRPNATHGVLRRAEGNTGNVLENKSLYWHPTIYKVVTAGSDGNGGRRFEAADVWFASAYYVWRTGQASAFPDGLKMRTHGADPVARATSHCAPEPTACERADGCDGNGDFLPTHACWELEINIKFPTCWDGVHLESTDESHVSWAEGCASAITEESWDPECFDLPCPASHPVRMPEIHFYTRILDYQGGQHVFSDGSDTFHADYMSGWNSTALQRVLDECENESDAASPDFFCSEQLKYRTPKVEGEQAEDGDILESLRSFQPAAVDVQRLIAPEAVDGMSELPRGACKGKLLG